MLVVVIFEGFARHVGLERVVRIGKIGERERHNFLLKRLGRGGGIANGAPRRAAEWPLDRPRSSLWQRSTGLPGPGKPRFCRFGACGRLGAAPRFARRFAAPAESGETSTCTSSFWSSGSSARSPARH